jgi:hypothetical protein
MNRQRFLSGRAWRGAWLLVIGCVVAAPVRGSDWPRFDPTADPLLSPYDPALWGPAPADADPGGRASRLRLFRMPTGFLSEPLRISRTDRAPADRDPVPAAPTAPAEADAGDNRMQFAAGQDNPFFDVQRPGDPGGVGFWRYNTQVQLVDTGSTSCTLALEAVRPAGLEFDGLKEGPTVVTPAVALFHEVTDGLALQGFVGQNVYASARWTDSLDRNLEYGMAVQAPVPTAGGEAARNLFVFLEALGRYRYEPPTVATGDPSVAWDLLPGLHWRGAENWWLSGGVVVPLGESRGNLWQISCSVQF